MLFLTPLRCAAVLSLSGAVLAQSSINSESLDLSSFGAQASSYANELPVSLTSSLDISSLAGAASGGVSAGLQQISSLASGHPEIASVVSEIQQNGLAGAASAVSGLAANPTIASLLSENPQVSSIVSKATGLLGGAASGAGGSGPPGAAATKPVSSSQLDGAASTVQAGMVLVLGAAAFAILLL